MVVTDTELDTRIALLEREIIADAADEHQEAGEIDVLAKGLAQAAMRYFDEATAPLVERLRASEPTRDLAT